MNPNWEVLRADPKVDTSLIGFISAVFISAGVKALSPARPAEPDGVA
jgi:hypothetical protein